MRHIHGTRSDLQIIRPFQWTANNHGRLDVGKQGKKFDELKAFMPRGVMHENSGNLQKLSVTGTRLLVE
jgi:hypothetical protein